MPALTQIRTTNLSSGEAVPVLGQGTRYLGEDPRRRNDELAALRLGLDLGLTLYTRDPHFKHLPQVPTL